MSSETPDHHTDDALELDRFRQEAKELGFAHGAANFGVLLESDEEFIARMRASGPEERPGPARRWWVAGGAVAASVALAFAFIQQTETPVSADPPPALDYEFASAVSISYVKGEDPRESLTLLSDAAAGAPEPTSSGEIQYKQTDSWFSESDTEKTSSIVPRVSETWLRPDGSWTTRDSLGTPLDPDGRGLSRLDPGRSKQIDETLPAGTIDADLPASLPTDPMALRAALLKQGECPQTRRGATRSVCLYQEVVSLFQTYVVSPDLASAVWAMLRGEDGFTSLGSVTDRAGREGIGISIIDPEQPQFRFVLIGSLSDGQLLGSEDILVKTSPDIDLPVPSVYSFTAIVNSEYVEAVPERS